MSIQNRKGTAVLACLMALLLLTLLGGLALTQGRLELRTAYYLQEETGAHYLAEAGIELMLFALSNRVWLPSGIKELLEPHFLLQDGGPSYLDGRGRSQFVGTRAQPDLEFRLPGVPPTSNPDWLVLFQKLGTPDRRLWIKLYAPSVSSAVATIESTGVTRGGIRRTQVITLIQRVGPLRLVRLPGSWKEIH